MEKLDISLKKEIYESDFYHNLLKEELEKIVSENTLKKNQLHLFTAYLYENHDEIEAGIYIINSSETKIKVNNLPLSLYYGEDKIYSEDLEVNKEIEPYSSVFKEFKVSKENLSKEYDLKDLRIGINDLRNIKKYPYINIDVNNIPQIKEYVNYRDIKKFLKNLPIIEEDQLTIDIFRNGDIEAGFYIIMLFRNSSSREITLKSIPLEVYTDGNLLVYKDTFRLSDDSLSLPGNSGKMMVITIPRKDFPFIEGEDLTKYKVEIK